MEWFWRIMHGIITSFRLIRGSMCTFTGGIITLGIIPIRVITAIIEVIMAFIIIVASTDITIITSTADGYR